MSEIFDETEWKELSAEDIKTNNEIESPQSVEVKYDTLYSFDDFKELVEQHIQQCNECAHAAPREESDWMHGANSWAESALHILNYMRLRRSVRNHTVVGVLIPEKEIVSNQWALTFLRDCPPDNHNILIPYSPLETADGSLIKDTEPFEASDTYIDPSLS